MKRRRFDQINVVPFIDVMLVLLAIVLTTASFIQFQVLDVALPKTEHQASAQNDDKATALAIDAQGEWQWQTEPMTKQALVETLTQTPPQRIALEVDEQAPFDSFVQLMDTLTQLNLTDRVQLITQAKH